MDDFRNKILTNNLKAIETSQHLDIIFEMASGRIEGLDIIKHFIDQVDSKTKLSAFSNACRKGNRENAKFIYERCTFSDKDIHRSFLDLIRKGHVDMIKDYKWLALYSSTLTNDTAIHTKNIEILKLIDSFGTNLLTTYNFNYVINLKCLEFVKYFHQHGMTTDVQMRQAVAVNADDIIYYFAKNGIDPIDNFWRRYVNLRKKSELARERYLANKVYYILIQKIYKYGSESSIRLGLASYQATIENRFF